MLGSTSTSQITAGGVDSHSGSAPQVASLVDILAKLELLAPITSDGSDEDVARHASALSPSEASQGRLRHLLLSRAIHPSVQGVAHAEMAESLVAKLLAPAAVPLMAHNVDALLDLPRTIRAPVAVFVSDMQPAQNSPSAPWFDDPAVFQPYNTDSSGTPATADPADPTGRPVIKGAPLKRPIANMPTILPPSPVLTRAHALQTAQHMQRTAKLLHDIVSLPPDQAHTSMSLDYVQHFEFKSVEERQVWTDTHLGASAIRAAVDMRKAAQAAGEGGGGSGAQARRLFVVVGPVRKRFVGTLAHCNDLTAIQVESVEEFEFLDLWVRAWCSFVGAETAE